MRKDEWLRKTLDNPNAMAVYEKLLRQGPLTRARLSEMTGLAPPTVYRIAAELNRANVVRSVHHLESNGGRPAELLGAVPNHGFLIGIDLGDIEISGALYNMAFENRSARSVPYRSQRPEALVATIKDLAVSLMEEAGVDPRQVVGIGVGVPGSVDRGRKVMGDSSILNIYNWRLADALSEQLDITVYVENNANLEALAELYHGQLGDQQNLIFVSLGIGIGMGLVLRGEIFHGDFGQAGELGHVIVLPNGPICTCGQAGCLEAVAGGWALAAAFSGNSPGSETPILTRADNVFRAAEEGDQLAKRLIDRAVEFIGLAVDNVINSLGVGGVVLGGYFTAQYPRFYEAVAARIGYGVIEDLKGRLSVRRSRHGLRGRVLGAATVVLAELFESSAARCHPHFK